MSILKTFVAVDLETTGLSPKISEILEIGAFKIQNGHATDQFQSYLKPTGSIPEEIVRLTSISEKTVLTAPQPETVLENFLEFTDGLPLITYQGRFEAQFLAAFSKLSFDSRLHSVREIVRIVLPQLTNHRLDTLSDFFSIQIEGNSKALRDAESLAYIYLNSLDLLRNIPLHLKKQLLILLQGTQSNILPILVELNNEKLRKESNSHIDRTKVTQQNPRSIFNIGGEKISAKACTGEILDLNDIQRKFEPNGPFDQENNKYEIRKEQIEMATAVGEAFNQSQFLAVEAGTGVGKSIAYLLPAVLYAIRNSTRVVVSTNTKNLQEQLFFKDLPELEAVLEDTFSYALLKGRGNYLCLNRWNVALTNPDSVFTEEERIAALPLVIWAENTKTGDISENIGFDLSRNSGLWAKVSSDSGFCRSQKCRKNHRCFANLIRKYAQNSQLVVVNHSLLFSELASENGNLGDYQHLILDEAHNVEKVATHYLGQELNIWQIKNLTDQIGSSGSLKNGSLASLQHWIFIANLNKTSQKAFEAGKNAALSASESLWKKAQIFFETLTNQMRKKGNHTNRYIEKVRYKPGESVFKFLDHSLRLFEDATIELGQRLESISDWIRALPENALPNQDELRYELENRIQECQKIKGNLNFLTTPNDERAVYWMELPKREDSIDTRLFSVPLNISKALTETLYKNLDTIIFTSATLSIRGKFSYFLQRMGLEKMPSARMKTLTLGSPFNFSKQALVCVPQFLPSPKSSGFQEEVNKFLKNLVSQVNRGTMALFTSHQMLNQTYKNIKTDLQSEGILLLAQGINGTRASITEQFKLDPNSMLLGTNSFWEGIDLPGETLQILGIIRLPFAVPSEPLVAAHLEEIEKQGKNSFLHYTVPEAILKFRQGFGRLIRNKTDRGAVVVLDNRVLNTNYGKAFLKALPVSHQTFQKPQEMINTIQTWFDQVFEIGESNKEEL